MYPKFRRNSRRYNNIEKENKELKTKLNIANGKLDYLQNPRSVRPLFWRETERRETERKLQEYFLKKSAQNK